MKKRDKKLREERREGCGRVRRRTGWRDKGRGRKVEIELAI